MEERVKNTNKRKGEKIKKSKKKRGERFSGNACKVKEKEPHEQSINKTQILEMKNLTKKKNCLP